MDEIDLDDKPPSRRLPDDGSFQAGQGAGADLDFRPRVQFLFGRDGQAGGDEAVDLSEVFPQLSLALHFQAVHDTLRRKCGHAFIGLAAAIRRAVRGLSC